MNLVEKLNQFCANTLVTNLGIVFTDAGSDYVKAKMPVDNRTMQPMGILHGGASFALAETVGSAGSFMLVDREQFDVVGMQMSGNHVATVSSGYVYAHGVILHKGTKTHVWDIRIYDENDKTTALCRLTNMIIEKS